MLLLPQFLYSYQSSGTCVSDAIMHDIPRIGTVENFFLLFSKRNFFYYSQEKFFFLFSKRRHEMNFARIVVILACLISCILCSRSQRLQANVRSVVINGAGPVGLTLVARYLDLLEKGEFSNTRKVYKFTFIEKRLEYSVI